MKPFSLRLRMASTAIADCQGKPKGLEFILPCEIIQAYALMFIR